MTESFDYMTSLNYLGEMQSETGDIKGSILTLTQVVELQRKVLKGAEKLESVFTLKVLAEELIKNGQRAEGLSYAELALKIQMDTYMGIVNSEVQETMLLVAEILTLTPSKVDAALGFYIEVLDARASVEPVIDIYRRMAPLYTQKGNYREAVDCLRKILV